MENKEIYGYIYLITNLVNNKQYVGQTIQTIKERFGGHCTSKNPVISKAIKKYGKKNFIVQELAVVYNQEDLTFLEGLYISWFNTLTPNGYNIAKIINGKGKHSEETKRKMKIARNKPERLIWASENGKKHRGKTRTNSKSKYCGVTINYNKYTSSIKYNSKRINLGSYNIETDAAKAYDIAAIKYFGNDAVLNFPELRQDYINNKIIVNKNKKISKSGIEGISFHKHSNMWKFRWSDKILNKRIVKYFKTFEEAVKFKNIICNTI